MATATTSFSLPDIGKPLLLGASFVLALPTVWGRVATLDSAEAGVIFVFMLILGWLGVVGAAWSRFTFTRSFWAIVLPVGLVLVEAYRLSTGDFLTYATFVDLLGLIGGLGGAIMGNIGAIIAALVPALILALGILVPPSPQLPWGITMMLMPISLAVVAMYVSATGGDSVDGLPQGITAVAYGALAAVQAVFG